MNFKAVMFDFDGTVTAKGKHSSSQKMANALIELSQKFPIAFCTGRQLESFERRTLSHLIKIISPEKRFEFFKNLFLFAENGAIGYDFNPEKACFEEVYQIKWPNEFINREKFQYEVNKKLKGYGEVYYSEHRIVVVITTKLYGEESKRIEKIYELSDKIYEIVYEFLKNISKDFEDYLHIGNSGIGVVIGPANGDKDTAIRKFGEDLRGKRGFTFDEKFREILVIGDRGFKGGNDHYFLKGNYGTSYTVGDKKENLTGEYPSPVLDKNGKQLFHDKGTFYLIKKILKNLGVDL